MAIQVEILREEPLLENREALSFVECPTVAKVTRAAFATLGVALPIVGVISGSPEVFALTLIGSFAALQIASGINDYEDPVELAKMRRQAKLMNWSQLVDKHSISNLSNVLSPWEIKEKFQEYYETRRFSKIMEDYPPSTIDRYGLAEFSQNSFLRNSLERDLRNFPLSTLRNWYNDSWKIEQLPYNQLLPFYEMDALLEIRGNLIAADIKHTNAISSLYFLYPERMEMWVKDLTARELEISRKVRIHGEGVEQSVKEAYECDISLATSYSEQLKIIEERDAVAQDARRDAEKFERERLESKILSERLSLLKNAIATDQQDRYDLSVFAANQEHAVQEMICQNELQRLLR